MGPTASSPIVRLRGEDNDACDATRRRSTTPDSRSSFTELKERERPGRGVLPLGVRDCAAGVCLGVNPFDQPNVEESKRNTKAALRDYGTTRSLPAPEDEGSFRSCSSPRGRATIWR